MEHNTEKKKWALDVVTNPIANVEKSQSSPSSYTSSTYSLTNEQNTFINDKHHDESLMLFTVQVESLFFTYYFI